MKISIIYLLFFKSIELFCSLLFENDFKYWRHLYIFGEGFYFKEVCRRDIFEGNIYASSNLYDICLLGILGFLLAQQVPKLVLTGDN